MHKLWTHSEIVEKAVKWLRKPHGQNGPGCHVAVSEFPTGFSGEIPDAIGYRSHTEHLGGTVLCEVKVSRSDFLADARKPHRNGTVLGVGQHRFYVAPQGLISVEELPKGWGLVEITSRGGTRCVAGFPSTTHYGNRESEFNLTMFETDIQREMNVLIRLCARIGDAEELNGIKRRNKKLEAENQALKKQTDKFELAKYLKQLDAIESSSTPISRQLQRARIKLAVKNTENQNIKEI